MSNRQLGLVAPHVRIMARAFDVRHLYLLRKAGVDVALREVFSSSLELAVEALKSLGLHPFKVEKMARAFRKHDEAGLEERFGAWDENPDIVRNRAFLRMVREHHDALAEVMATDRLQLHDRSERGWTPPPKGYTSKLDGDSESEARPGRRVHEGSKSEGEQPAS